MDLITDLSPAERYDSILVVVDQGLSKGVILLPWNKTLTSEDTAKLLLENLYKQFGLLDKIISNRGSQFASKAFKELLNLLGIKSALSTAYHPQTEQHRVEQHLMELHITNLQQQTTQWCPDAMSTSPTSQIPSLLSDIESEPHRRSLNNHEPPSNPSSHNISIHDWLFDQSEDRISNPRRNPIYVLDDDEVRCEGCWEEGHFIGDCN